jgi:hypothetical protein
MLGAVIAGVPPLIDGNVVTEQKPGGEQEPDPHAKSQE